MDPHPSFAKTIGLTLAMSLALVGCDLGGGVWTQNDTNHDLLVQFVWNEGGSGTAFPVPAGHGRPSIIWFGGHDSWPNLRIQVLTADCGHLWEKTGTFRDFNALVVHPNQTVDLLEGDAAETYGQVT